MIIIIPCRAGINGSRKILRLREGPLTEGFVKPLIEIIRTFQKDGTIRGFQRPDEPGTFRERPAEKPVPFFAETRTGLRIYQCRGKQRKSASLRRGGKICFSIRRFIRTTRFSSQPERAQTGFGPFALFRYETRSPFVLFRAQFGELDLRVLKSLVGKFPENFDSGVPVLFDASAFDIA